MAQPSTIFISAVSREFEKARDAVANALQARGYTVFVQRSFAQGDQSTLAEMHDIILKSDVVLAVIGAYSGMFPPEGAVTDDYRKMRPPGIDRASITQWEIIFARHYGKQVFYFEAAGFTPEQKAGDGNDPESQAAWRHYLFDGHLGLFRRQFSTAADLRADVMELDWPNRAKRSNLPGSIGHLFKGREDFLRRLRDSFKDHRAAAITGKAVHGLGGVGKTRTAIEYGHEYAGEYTATFFLTGKSPNDLSDSLAALCGVNELNLPEKDVPDLDARVAAVIEWLRDNPGWLLVIDNVDDEPAASAVRTFLNQVSQAGGHVLITSRVSDWRGGVEPLELDLLSVEAAKDLLRESTPRRTKTDDEEAALAYLADEQLGCLSLALVQAGAYIDQKRISFARYSDLFGQEAKALLAKLGKRAMDDLDYPRPVALTWQTSFAQLSDAGRLLLDMLSWLSIEPIPRSLFEVWPQADTIDLDDALEELTRYSLVHWEEDNSAITVHRLVAQVTRDNLDDGTRSRALNALFPWLKAVNSEMNADDVRCWPKLLPMLPHALKLYERTGDLGPFTSQASLYDEYAGLQQGLARYKDAEPFFRRALAIDEASLGPNHPIVATHLNNLALLLQHTSRFDEAEPLCRRALAIDEAKLGPNHPSVAVRLNNLALLLRATNRLAEAAPLYRRALSIDEASLGPDHPHVAIRLNNLAGVLLANDRLAEAEPLVSRALAINEASLGSDHPDVATFLTNLAVIYMATKRLTEAEPLVRRALAINETSLGSDHPRTAGAVSILAGLLRKTGCVAEAEPLYRRALAIEETSFGLDHPTVATGLNNLAEFLRVTNRLAEAEPLYRRASLILLRSSRASGHLLPNTIQSLRTFVFVLATMNRSPENIADSIASIIVDAGLDPSQLWPLVFSAEC